MVIFLNDYPVRVISEKSLLKLRQTLDFDIVIDTRLEGITPANWQGHVLLLNVTVLSVNKILVALQNDISFKHLQSITLVSVAKKEVENALKSQFKIVKAAGGVVLKDEQVLMIYRLKRWDLPKGKLDDDEKSKQASVREVAEECGINVALGKRICTTWHTYTHNNKAILKRTKWYLMHCTNDSAMQPQIEEGIEKIAWMNTLQLQNSLIQSYSSIRYVIEQYLILKSNNFESHIAAV